jgi:predicted nuclease of predicted toxin-antitoxin system
VAQFYADENFPLPVVQFLRQLGHDVLTIGEAGRANQQYSDAAVLQHAESINRCILTLNRKHFRRLHENGARHAGIILCTYDPDFGGQARRIDEAVATFTTLAGQLIRVNRPAP